MLRRYTHDPASALSVRQRPTLYVLLVVPMIVGLGMLMLSPANTAFAWRKSTDAYHAEKRSQFMKDSCPFNHCKDNENNENDDVIPITLVVPCESEDWDKLPEFLESVANQTRRPYETILILSTTDVSTHTQLWYPETNSKEGIVAMPMSVDSIPRLQMHTRSGLFYAGQNRMFGSSHSHSSCKFITFFDCDDYMHPQRLEVLFDTFEENPQVDAILHSATEVHDAKWPYLKSTYLSEDLSPYMHPVQLPWKPDEILSALTKVYPEKWDIRDRMTEPSWPESPLQKWWFHRFLEGYLPPLDDSLSHPYNKWKARSQNGWLTVRKDVLTNLPYPVDASRGQDAIYNFRLIKSGARLVYVNLPIGVYLRPRPVVKSRPVEHRKVKP